MIDGMPPEKGWLEKILTGSAAATILVALIGQAVFSVVFQIRNNEQQSAAIEANKLAVATLRNEIVNLQTPLSSMVLRMDGRLSSLETEYKALDTRMNTNDAATNARVDNIDKNGTRAMELVTSNQSRVFTQIDRLGERMNATDARVNEVQSRGVLVLQNQVDLIRQDIKRIDEQQARIISALDAQYNTITEFLRTQPRAAPSLPLPKSKQ